MHDLNHTGKSNGFMSAAYSELATTYNDQSVLENHHVATAFKILKENKYDIFDNLTNADFKKLRKRTIANILATDMQFHFAKMKKFKEYNESGDKNEDKKGESNIEIGEIMLHLADLAHPSMKWKLCNTWSLRVCKEFMAQNEVEKQLPYIPETPFYKNLDVKSVMAKGEYSFIHFCVMPFWNIMNEYVNGEFDMQVANLKANKQKWLEKFTKNYYRK